jgi:low affinity Fe/Cu permease
MKKISRHIEYIFERVTSVAIAVLGSSITFILAFAMVMYWLCNKEFYTQSVHDSLRDIIHGVTFLSLFLIQKSFNRFSASLHLKVNELVASHETASNAVIHTEQKTERELTELSKEYAVIEAEINNDEVVAINPAIK